MRSTWLRPSLLALLLGVPAVASAGGGGGSSTGMGTGSDTGMGSGSDTGTGTGGSDTGTGSGGSSSSGEPCSECIDSTDPVQIISPANGATVATTTDVRITAPYTCSCDGCACSQRPPFSVSIRVDGMTVTSCSDGSKGCNTEDQTFTIELEPGTHTLDAAAEHDGQPEFSDPIEVTVPGSTDDSTGTPPPPPPPPPPSTSSSGSDSTGTPAASGDGGGCGCRTEGGRASAGLLAMLALLGLGRRRRA